MFTLLKAFKYHTIDTITIQYNTYLDQPMTYFVQFKMNAFGRRKVELEYCKEIDKIYPILSPLNHVFYTTVCQKFINKIGVFRDSMAALEEINNICKHLSGHKKDSEDKTGSIKRIKDNILTFPGVRLDEPK